MVIQNHKNHYHPRNHSSENIMNSLNQNTILKTGWMRSLALAAIGTLMLASCKQSTAPESEAGMSDATQMDISRDAADVSATSVGTESGGAGVAFLDALTLAQGGQIQGAIVKGGIPQSDDTIHTATVTRSKNKNGYGYSGSWTHTWVFRDIAGAAMPKFIKGVTNEIDITTKGQHDITTPRLHVADSSNGSWVINNLIAQPNGPTLNGAFTRAGETVNSASGKSRTHTYTINFTNDLLIRTYDDELKDTVVYLQGNANSDFQAVGFKGQTFERKVDIVFNGDGTATLTVTRTSGNGKTDTFTIDVKRGIWLRDGKIK
jgi:hypothetical protein